MCGLFNLNNKLCTSVIGEKLKITIDVVSYSPMSQKEKSDFDYIFNQNLKHLKSKYG